MSNFKDKKNKERINKEEQEKPQTKAQVTEEKEAQDIADSQKECADKVEQLEQQVAELKDKYLRQVAEFDNYRKRTLKEKSELILNGGEKVITTLLPILDDMERAAQNIEKSDDVEALKEGLKLVFQKLQKALESQGLKKIETNNKDFDTDYHEAIAMVPAQSSEQKGKVLDCVQTGYTLNDKVIRHAKVAIGQ